MFKKIFFALILLFAGTVAASFCPNRASALELDKDSDIYKKIIRQNIKDCYLNEPLSNKVFPKNWPNDEYKSLFGDSKWVNMPTGYTPLEENKVTCKGFMYGDASGSGAKGQYDGILDIFGKSISNRTGLETKKKLAVGFGYEPSPDGELDNPSAPLYYALTYKYDLHHEWKPGCGILWLGYCEEDSGPYDAATFVTGTKVSDNGTVASKLETFSSGNGTDLGEAGISYKENNNKSGGTLSIICEDFEKSWGTLFKEAFTNISNYDYAEGFECVNGDLSVSYNQTIWNDGDAKSGDSATAKSIVGFLNKHLPLNFSIIHETWDTNIWPSRHDKTVKDFTVTGTISSDPNYTDNNDNITLPGQYNKIANWDDRAVKGMEYFTGGTNRFFTDSEIYTLYAGYLTDYYKTSFQCGADKAEHYAGREGYVKAGNILYDGEMQDECYVKATANADKKVNGVSSYNFDGADRGGGNVFHGQKTFEELLQQIADLNVTPESIAEANIAATGEDNESGSSESDPCYNAGVEGMSWILCPVINNSSRSVSAVEGLIRDWLQINPENTIEKGQAYKAWEIFRNFANAFLIIIFLIIIFSQLTGYGIDNYGIKKMLPRLIVMGILINLSYILCELAIDLSNILGVGLDNLFKSIGEGINPTGANLTGQAIVAVVLGLITAGGTIAGIAIASGGGVMIIVSLVLALLVALISVLMFFVMLGARMIIVILFTILSPVAFALYILPNTQSIFKKWWKVFEAALIVYPICGALYGMSTIIKAIVIDSNGNAEFIPGIIAVVAPFLPFLTLPTLLKSAMAGLGALGGTLTMLGNGLRKGAQSGSGAIQSGIKGSERYKNSMQDRARNRQIKMMDRGIDRLQNKRRPLTGNEELRLARMQQTQDKLRNEDRAARAIVEQNRTKDMDLSGLSKEWNDAWEAGNKEKLDAMTSVINSRYGAAGANEIAKRIATKNIANDENSQSMMKVLQNNMNHDSTLANNMRNKASDAYGMISDGGKDRNGNYQNLSHFTDNNEIAKSDKDWSTQSSATLQRAIDSGRLTKDQIKRILNSSDTSIQSGLDDDKRKVLRDAVPEFTTPVQSTPITSGNAMTDEAELNALLRQQRQNNGSGNDKRSPGGVILP